MVVGRECLKSRCVNDHQEGLPRRTELNYRQTFSEIRHVPQDGFLRLQAKALDVAANGRGVSSNQKKFSTQSHVFLLGLALSRDRFPACLKVQSNDDKAERRELLPPTHEGAGTVRHELCTPANKEGLERQNTGKTSSCKADCCTKAAVAKHRACEGSRHCCPPS